LSRTLTIGSRGSQLALWQANHMAAALRALGHSVTIQIIKTTGDRLQEAAFRASVAGTGVEDGKGIFIKEIEEALAAGTIDLAVHSLKDLPTELAAEFTIAAIPQRVDPRDALITPQGETLMELPEGARVGTTSPRRQTQLLAMRGDLRFVEMRGNVDTRLRKLKEGQAEALVLAAAGLERLGLTAGISQRFAVTEMCPAPGQGALAIECRSNDAETKMLLGALDDAATRYAVTAERVGLSTLGGGCSVPIGIHCEATAGGYVMHGALSAGAGAGTTLARREMFVAGGVSADAAGRSIAQALTKL
jgi:hydroxymethylbilane synthase